MSAEEPLDRIVLRYLQKRGYKDAEKAFLKDSKSQKLSEMALAPHLGPDAAISDHILYYNEEDADPNSLVQGYRLLRDWVNHSLDMYKVRPRPGWVRTNPVVYPRKAPIVGFQPPLT